MDKPANPFPNLKGEGLPDWIEQDGDLENERGLGDNREIFYSICSRHIEPDSDCKLCRTGTWEKQRTNMEKLDPYQDAEKILKDNNAEVVFSDKATDSFGNSIQDEEFAGWSLVWKHGVIGWMNGSWSQEKANMAGAMFIYLFQKGVSAMYADELAGIWANRQDA